jgi:hypothetical protein
VAKWLWCQRKSATSGGGRVAKLWKKEPQKIEKNEQARLGANLKPGEQNGLLADSQRGSGPKEKADAGIVKEEEKSARV